MNISVIAIGITLALIGLALLASVWAGVKSVMNGKQDLKKSISILVPFAVFGGSFAVFGTAADAGIATMLFMLALMAAFVVFTGLRSTLNF